MATDEHPETAGRRRVHIALVAGCVLATVLAALLVPALAADDIAGTPIDSVLPGERFEGSGGGAGGSGGFGALNPGDQTGVGGETGFDSDTFGANDTSVHFEVESAEPAYWRTGSYDTYTGSGWEGDGEMSGYDPPLDPVGLTDGDLEFEVTLAEPATAIPTAWQPRRVSGVEDLRVTDGGAIRATSVVDSGTTVTGASQRQENDVSLLRAAGEEYPADVADRYTQLPDDTPGRVGEFTDDLTDDDTTPYDAAVTIQNWLRSEKGYSLTADERSDHVADAFIFEMEAGYCEYFATAMTTMLRTQDVPARYTVGYSTGQPVAEDTYEVRGMNAHAWVEVYFPEVGWVKFDPTPGGSRLDAQSETLEEELGEAFDLQEPGSPGETFEPGGVTEETDPDDDGDDDDGRYDISLNRTAVPGLPVEIDVARDGRPAPDMAVVVNGEEVGTTGSDGTLVITVPDEDELHIAVRPDLIEFETNGSSATDRLTVPGGPSSTPDSGERLFSYGLDSTDLRFLDEHDETADNGESNTTAGDNSTGDTPSDEPGFNVTNRPTTVDLDLEENTTVDVETDATLSVTGDVLPGETVTVTATVADVAVPDASVFVDGEQVGTTDGNGRVTVDVPAEPGNATLVVERGPVSGRETLTVPGIDLSVSTEPLALPFTSATATVTAGGKSIAGAPVVVDGERVGTTGADGTAAVRLPLSPAATVETTSDGLRDSETVDGLLRNLAFVVAGTVAVVAVSVRFARRRNPSVDGFLSGIAETVDRVLTHAQLALLGAVRHGGPWLASMPRRVRAVLARMLDAVRGRASLAELRGALLAWLAAKRWRSGWNETAADEPSPEEPAASDGGVRQAWGRFLARVSVADPSAHTPGELAAHAIEEDGLPAGPVEALLTAFRAVEYGSQPPKAHLDRTRRALDRLETHADSPATAGGGGRNARRDRPPGGVSTDGGGNADNAASRRASRDERRSDGDDRRTGHSGGGSS